MNHIKPPFLQHGRWLTVGVTLYNVALGAGFNSSLFKIDQDFPRRSNSQLTPLIVTKCIIVFSALQLLSSWISMTSSLDKQ